MQLQTFVFMLDKKLRKNDKPNKERKNSIHGDLGSIRRRHVLSFYGDSISIEYVKSVVRLQENYVCLSRLHIVGSECNPISPKNEFVGGYRDCCSSLKP